jgi:prepilin-type processing-associated H-X9-DG protein
MGRDRQKSTASLRAFKQTVTIRLKLMIANLNYRRRQIGKSTIAGFTLVELLVSAGIIALLATLTVGALARAKRVSRRSACMSNLRQHGIALYDFVVQNQAYPLALNRGNPSGLNPDHMTSWQQALYPNPSFRMFSADDAHAALGVFHCPSSGRPAGWPAHDGFSEYGYNFEGIMGGANDSPLGLGATEITDGFGSPVREVDVVAPSSMAAIGDGFLGWKDVIQDGVGKLGRAYTAQENLGSSARADKRHEGRMIIVMCDGHIERPSLKEMFAGKSATFLQKWNRDNQAHSERVP